MALLKWIYIGFGICFYMGRIFEAERQDWLRERGTMYTVSSHMAEKKEDEKA